MPPPGITAPAGLAPSTNCTGSSQNGSRAASSVSESPASVPAKTSTFASLFPITFRLWAWTQNRRPTQSVGYDADFDSGDLSALAHGMETAHKAYCTLRRCVIGYNNSLNWQQWRSNVVCDPGPLLCSLMYRR